MKRRIEQLLNGIFEYRVEPLLIEPSEVSVLAAPGSVARGTLHLKSESEKKIKGFVYPSSPRIVCMPQQFQGISHEVFYQIDCSGLMEGACEEAAITICTDQGEYVVPVKIQISENPSAEYVLPFASLEEFAKLAESEFQRAYRYFVHPEFLRFLKINAPQFLDIYRGFTASGSGYQSLEYFLQETKQKEQIELSLSTCYVEAKGLSSPAREILTLTKNTWGFETIRIETDSRFIRPERKVITTDEFAGSTLELNVILDTNLMHAGINYGRLFVTMGGKTQRVEFQIAREGQHRADKQNHTRKIMMKKMESLYVQFRLKKIDLSSWVENSISVINSYRRADGNDPFADLFLVQLYYADGKQQKAMHILEQLESQKRRLDTPERYGFYLYMTTFFYHEAAYVDRVEEEIEKLFCRDRSNWILQWILFYLQEYYLQNEDARYEAVEKQFDSGCRSRIMYLEAYQILKKSPFYMRHLSAFELAILRFAMKEDVLTAEIMRQVSTLAMHTDTFDARLFEILTAGYQLYPSADLVKAICHILIKGEKKDSFYFPWYEKGVESEIRMTGLYEYYMETMDCLDIQKMPQIIRMYFAYDNSLDHTRRAAIYRRIVEQQENDPQTYHHYHAAMEKFTLDQLNAERISEDMAVLYRKFLRKSMLSKILTEKLARLLFTYEISCDSLHMKKVVLCSSHLAKEVTGVLTEQKCYVQNYDPESLLLFEDEEGVRYPGSAHATVKRMFECEKMVEWCRELVPSNPGIVLDCCVRAFDGDGIGPNNIHSFVTACELDEFSDDYRKRLRKAVLHYYTKHLRDESLEGFLDMISYSQYIQVNKADLITLLAEEGRCVDAFELLDEFGAEEIPLVGLVRICSRMVLEGEFEENSMLVSLCHYCFKSGKYDDKLLRYLLLYYEGPAEDMFQVWKAAQGFELDTISLEEKILVMLLFTHGNTAGSEPVFDAYLQKMGRKKLCRAYANLKAYEYFVKELPTADCIFGFLEREYEKNRLSEQETELVCKLALLKYYSGLDQLKENQRENVSELLADTSAEGLRFSFWNRFARELTEGYEMEGRVFAEYVGDPKNEVKIIYRVTGDGSEPKEEMMKNCFEGVFVREFTLFPGETLEYRMEEYGEETKETDICILTPKEDSVQNESRYHQLGRIIKLAEQGKEQEAMEEIEAYRLTEYLAQELFTII